MGGKGSGRWPLGGLRRGERVTVQWRPGWAARIRPNSPLGVVIRERIAEYVADLGGAENLSAFEHDELERYIHAVLNVEKIERHMRQEREGVEPNPVEEITFLGEKAEEKYQRHVESARKSKILLGLKRRARVLPTYAEHVAAHSQAAPAPAAGGRTIEQRPAHAAELDRIARSSPGHQVLTEKPEEPD